MLVKENDPYFGRNEWNVKHLIQSNMHEDF